MVKKHKRVLILLVGLLYVYSVCPLLCATFEQKLCHDTPQDMVHEGIATRVTCCQRTQTDTAGDTENSSDSGETCCSTDLELVLPDNRHNAPEFHESIGQSIVSVLPISATLSVAPQESSNTVPSILLISTLFRDHALIRRGPPSIQC